MGHFVGRARLRAQFLKCGMASATVPFLRVLALAACGFVVVAIGRSSIPAAAASAQAHRMSVERLLRLADGTPFSPPLPGWSPALSARLASEQADLYISGVVDTGEGVRWCLSHARIPPHEVNQAVIAALRPAASPTGNAAMAVGKALAALYPCGKPR